MNQSQEHSSLPMLRNDRRYWTWGRHTIDRLLPIGVQRQYIDKPCNVKDKTHHQLDQILYRHLPNHFAILRNEQRLPLNRKHQLKVAEWNVSCTYHRLPSRDIFAHPIPLPSDWKL
jgi:hypothetical protein